ncbi:MAG TPA: glycosyltransferase 87 family protein, partial [Candidatus Dormibacteraeota bacterium]|nr:glycosyltransferase 87 family protein [Candidatus Dormibacteraeota bacterium]
IGLLMYKPSIAAPFLIVLVARREWRSLAVAAACAACWYLLSVPAAGGDWAWPKTYVAELGAYYTPDFLSNAANAVSLPGLLARFGVPSAIAIGAGVAVLAACLPRLVRVGSVEALSITSALAVALSPHAWRYEPVMLLPAIFYAMRIVPQPAITWLVVAAYVIADVSILDLPGLTWNVLIVVVLFWTALVVAKASPLPRLSS